MKIIGIAGGSGAGKSTVSYLLEDAEPDTVEVLNVDDYQKLNLPGATDLPMHDGMINWDHPDIIRWDDLRRDILILRSGEPVTIKVWAHRSNPEYHLHKQMMPRTILPKPILIIEGYLALYDKTIRELCDTTFYLEIDEETRTSRRDKGAVVKESEYETKVLVPMHAKYVAPTKNYADHIIDVSTQSAETVAAEIKRLAAWSS